MKGSKTEQNLLKAFAGESQTRMRYDFFAKVAAKALEVYPACLHPKSYMQIREENY